MQAASTTAGRGRLRGAMDIDEEQTPGKAYDQRVVLRVLKYLSGVKMMVGLGAFGMLLRTLAHLTYPYLSGMAFDYIVAGDALNLGWTALGYIVAAAIGSLAHFMELRFLTVAGQAVLLKMRTTMFGHLQKLSLAFFDHNSVGRLMSRVQNDVQHLEHFITAGTLHIFTDIITVVGIAAILLVRNGQLALITLATIPVLAFIIIIWQKYASRAFIRVRQAIANVNAGLQENISGVRVVQSLTREEENLEQFDEANREHLGANIKSTQLAAIMRPTVEILMAAAEVIILIFGGMQVISGQMTAGTLLAFLMYIRRFFMPLRELTREYTQLQRTMASGQRIFDLLDTEPEITDSEDAIELPPIEREIKFDHVSFSYEQGIEVIHDLDVIVNAGETIALVGKTGAGKSTMMKLLCRFYEIDSGRILVDGHDIKQVKRESLMKQIGVVPQDPFLFSGTIEENIRYGRPQATTEEIIEVSKMVGSHQFVERMEQGYQTEVGERGGNVSGGQRQLICLARMVLAGPRILIMDEPTSSVDSMAEAVFQNALRTLRQDRTCFIIAHRLATVTSADRIIVLDEGTVVESGSHQELMADKGLYYEMVGSLSADDNIG